MTTAGLVALYYFHRYWYYGKIMVNEFDKKSEKEHLESAYH